MNKFELIKDNYPYYWFKKSEYNNNNVPIVYIHGFADHPRWLFDCFNKINNRDIYCIELPGHYETPLKNKEQLKPINMAKEIKSLIEKINLDKFILIGHSMGGGISLMLNYLFKGEKIEKIILISPMNSHGVGLKQIYNFIFNFVYKKKDKSFYKLLVSDKYVDELHNRTIGQLKNNFSSRKENYKTLMKNLISINNFIWLKKAEKSIKCKSLLILGDNDRIINSTKTSFFLKMKYKNINVKIFKNVGHMAFYEEKDMFYQLIDNFINDLL